MVRELIGLCGGAAQRYLRNCLLRRRYRDGGSPVRRRKQVVCHCRRLSPPLRVGRAPCCCADCLRGLWGARNRHLGDKSYAPARHTDAPLRQRGRWHHPETAICYENRVGSNGHSKGSIGADCGHTAGTRAFDEPVSPSPGKFRRVLIQIKAPSMQHTSNSNGRSC